MCPYCFRMNEFCVYRQKQDTVHRHVVVLNISMAVITCGQITHSVQHSYLLLNAVLWSNIRHSDVFVL